MIYNSNIMYFNYYNFIVIIRCNVGYHSEHTKNIRMLTSHRISLLFVLYKMPDEGLVN